MFAGSLSCSTRIPIPLPPLGMGCSLKIQVLGLSIVGREIHVTRAWAILVLHQTTILLFVLSHDFRLGIIPQGFPLVQGPLATSDHTFLKSAHHFHYFFRGPI